MATRREGFDHFNRTPGRAPGSEDVQDNTHRTQVLVRQLNSKRMGEPVSNSVELKNAGLDERLLGPVKKGTKANGSKIPQGEEWTHR